MATPAEGHNDSISVFPEKLLTLLAEGGAWAVAGSLGGRWSMDHRGPPNSAVALVPSASSLTSPRKLSVGFE